MQSKLSDNELIQRSLAGDQSAYAELVKRHQRFVFTLALRFAKNREDAEEIAQDSFIKAFRALNTFKQESKFSTWLYSIVYTTAMTSLRKKRVDTASIDSDDAFIQIASQPSGFDSYDIENKSRSFYLNQAIAQLGADDAAVITLFYKGEQSIDEIAKTMGIEPNGVKVKLFRARQRLKDKLERNLKHEVKELI